jgi:RimJ/RimL family protein N-acetyltransferase
MEETTIETRRLILRPFVAEDEFMLAAALNDFEISRWLSRVPFPYTRKDAAWFISQRANAGGAGRICAIAFKSMPAAVIGCVAHEPAEGQPHPEFGYWLARAYWGRGLMSEAARALIEDTFAHQHADELASGYWNPVSGALLRKLGFVETGKRKMFSLALGAEVESTVLRLTRAMWQAQTQSRAA